VRLTNQSRNRSICFNRRRSASTGAESASTGADLLQQEPNQPIGGRGWWIGGRGDGREPIYFRSLSLSLSLSLMAIFQSEYVFLADLLG
jgi:hypothetical protein